MRSITIGSPIEIEAYRAELPPEFTIEDSGKKFFEFDSSGFSLSLFVLGWAAGIPASVIANAIYDAIKKRSKKEPTRISINKRIIRFDRGQIVEVIEHELKIECQDN